MPLSSINSPIPLSNSFVTPYAPAEPKNTTAAIPATRIVIGFPKTGEANVSGVNMKRIPNTTKPIAPANNSAIFVLLSGISILFMLVSFMIFGCSVHTCLELFKVRRIRI
jgi:hypothetical protein